MCGIAGAIDLSGSRDFSRPRLLAMIGAIAHRGPDDEHVHLERGLALGSRRLSIVDPESGRQPMSNERGDVWVAVNGELFDYPELRRKLSCRGHRLATRCDTELWVHLYEEFGEDMFVQALGQFAFSLWDRERHILYLGRDRMGICPLYYSQHDDWLIWGSEIKALLASGMFAPRPDARAINHFFNFSCAGTPRTYFEGVKSIPPGHYLKIHGGRIELRQYWDLHFPDAGDELRYDDARVPIEELEQLLRRAVRRRLRADVPVACYLSGGIDSAILLSLSSQEQDDAVQSFTIGLNGTGSDERAEAAECAALHDSPLNTVLMDSDSIAASYPDLIRAVEGPVLDTSCACMMRLAETVHDQGYKVALSGQGADEALAGYTWYKAQAIGDKFGHLLPKLVHRAILASIGGGKAHRPPWNAMAGVRTAQQAIAESFAQTRESLFTAEMWDRLDGHSAYDDLGLTNDRITRWHPLNQSLYAGYKIMLPGLLLMAKGDRVAMKSAVEIRYPFLDEDVVAFCAQLDPGYKLKRLTDKWLLRRVAAGLLPQRIARRRKTMFRAALSRTFLRPVRPAWVDQLLSPESLRATGYFNPEAVAAVREMQASKPPITPRRACFDVGLTAVIATQLWHHIYCGGGLAEVSSWSPADIPA